MTTEQRRMYQRRGLKADLPNTPENGEIYLTLDTEEMYVGVNGNLLKTLTPKDVVDNLTTDSATLPLSAKQGLHLQGRVNSLETFVNDYTGQVDTNISVNNDLVNKLNDDVTEIKSELQDIKVELDGKQDMLISNDTTPPNINFMWCDPNEN